MLKLGVSPGGQFIEDLIKSSVGRNFEVEFFESAADLNQFLNSENQTVVGIEFEQSLAVSASISKSRKDFIDIS